MNVHSATLKKAENTHCKLHDEIPEKEITNQVEQKKKILEIKVLVFRYASSSFSGSPV